MNKLCAKCHKAKQQVSEKSGSMICTKGHIKETS